jgi:hypothetical protein
VQYPSTWGSVKCPSIRQNLGRRNYLCSAAPQAELRSLKLPPTELLLLRTRAQINHTIMATNSGSGATPKQSSTPLTVEELAEQEKALQELCKLDREFARVELVQRMRPLLHQPGRNLLIL